MKHLIYTKAVFPALIVILIFIIKYNYWYHTTYWGYRQKFDNIYCYFGDHWNIFVILIVILFIHPQKKAYISECCIIADNLLYINFSDWISSFHRQKIEKDLPDFTKVNFSLSAFILTNYQVNAVSDWMVFMIEYCLLLLFFLQNNRIVLKNKWDTERKRFL